MTYDTIHLEYFILVWLKKQSVTFILNPMKDRIQCNPKDSSLHILRMLQMFKEKSDKLNILVEETPIDMGKEKYFHLKYIHVKAVETKAICENLSVLGQHAKWNFQIPLGIDLTQPFFTFPLFQPFH
jgi:hypothetical protein